MSAIKSKSTGGKKETVKNSLVKNINAKKKAGTSKTKNKSTVSNKAYSDMEKDWKKTK
ncbi:MAG: hypothetical protein ABIY50_08420 [Ignavibacteria bacterium]